MDFLNIKIINGNHNEYYGSGVLYSNGTFIGIGEEYNYHSLLTFDGNITYIDDVPNLYMAITFEEREREIIKLSSKLTDIMIVNESPAIQKLIFSGKTLDKNNNAISIEVIYVHKYAKTQKDQKLTRKR